jgi:hypothetical protein
MRPAWSSKLHARGGFWAMLFIAAVGSVGLQALALSARASGDDAWVDAVYHFRSDTLPSCEQLAGRPQLPLSEGNVDWVRLGGLGASTTIDGRCQFDERVAM